MAKEIREIIEIAQKTASQGNDQRAIDGLKRLSHDVNYAVKEGFLPKKLPQDGSSKTERSQDLEAVAIQEYKTQPLTPELVNRTWQTLWKVWGERVGHVFDVPTCDRTEPELAELKESGKAVLLIPDEFYTPESLVLLGRIFPKMQSRTVSEGTTITNENNSGGCIDVEMDLESPNRNTTEEQAREILEVQGRKGQREATYIVASQFSRLLTSHYFDENSWSRLPGSRRGGFVVRAFFDSSGRLSVYSFLGPLDQGPDLGVRSEGVKKA